MTKDVRILLSVREFRLGFVVGVIGGLWLVANVVAIYWVYIRD